MKRTILLFLSLAMIFSLTTISAHAQEDDGDAITGLWLPSNGKARIYIYKSKKSGKYFGQIVWLREPNDPDTGKPKVDKNNPDEDKREKPLKGYVMLRGMEYNADEKTWEGGTIYDPNNGSTYSCEIEMPNKNKLDVRGFIGVSMFGRTDEWKRMKMKDK